MTNWLENEIGKISGQLGNVNQYFIAAKILKNRDLSPKIAVFPSWKDCNLEIWCWSHFTLTHTKKSFCLKEEQTNFCKNL